MEQTFNSKGSSDIWSRVRQVRFFWLLVALIGFILTTPALPDTTSGKWEATTLGLVILFAASYVSRGIRKYHPILFLGILVVITTAVDVFLNDSASSRLILISVMLSTLTQTSVNVLSFVLEGGKVTLEHIYGAICAYILIAMAFAGLYFVTEILMPGSFTGVHAQSLAERPWWQFFYFSMSTQTTVGYGDIVPLTMRARSFVMVQQLFAVFYAAILIARLTGMYANELRPLARTSGNDSA